MSDLEKDMVWIEFNNQIGSFIGIYEDNGIIKKDIFHSYKNAYGVVQCHDKEGFAISLKPEYILYIPDYPERIKHKAKINKNIKIQEEIYNKKKEIERLEIEIKELDGI